MTRTQSFAREGSYRMKRLPAAREAVRDSLAGLAARLHGVDARTRALIQERPLTALAAAVAAGFVLRRVVRFVRP